MIYLDIETDGLNPTKIWMAVTRQDGGVLVHYTPDTLLDALQGSEKVIGHNLIGYDLPVLKSLWGVSVAPERVEDTLVLSRLANPQRDKGHSLRSWGERLGFPKGDYNDWTQCSQEMEDYCVQDTAVTERVYLELFDELAEFSQESIDLEHKVQFIIQQQIRNGWFFDERKAYSLLADLKEKQVELEDEVHRVFKPKLVKIKTVTPKLKKDGTLSKQGLTEEEFCKVSARPLDKLTEPFDRCKLQEFNLNSRKQIGEYLQEFGWKPSVFTETGQAQVDEKILETVKGIREAKLISEFLMLQKRTGQVQGWLDALSPTTGRIHGKVNSNGAVTGRMTHNSPNTANTVASYSPYGKECRECWTVPEGYKLVGMDASGLELRMLAHYMDDKEYTNELVTGDIHTTNQRLAGLKSRDTAKTFIYALLYSAGNERLGQVVGGNEKTGKRLRERFNDNLKSFGVLRERVQSEINDGSQMVIEGLDGRKLHIRSQHSALNTLLQSAGALVMKQALILLDEYAKLWGLDFKFVGNIHDEIQTEVKEDQAEKFGILAVECLIAAGNHFNLNCPLAVEYKIGDTWYETH